MSHPTSTFYCSRPSAAPRRRPARPTHPSIVVVALVVLVVVVVVVVVVVPHPLPYSYSYRRDPTDSSSPSPLAAPAPHSPHSPPPHLHSPPPHFHASHSHYPHASPTPSTPPPAPSRPDSAASAPHSSRPPHPPHHHHHPTTSSQPPDAQTDASHTHSPDPQSACWPPESPCSSLTHHRPRHPPAAPDPAAPYTTRVSYEVVGRWKGTSSERVAFASREKRSSRRLPSDVQRIVQIVREFDQIPPSVGGSHAPVTPSPRRPVAPSPPRPTWHVPSHGHCPFVVVIRPHSIQFSLETRSASESAYPSHPSGSRFSAVDSRQSAVDHRVYR